jgi:hypothetical protein
MLEDFSTKSATPAQPDIWPRKEGQNGALQLFDYKRKKWRAPPERIRTASEIPIEVDLTDEDAVPIYMKISEKVLHLRRLGMPYATIAERLKINLWMAKRAARGARPTTNRGSPSH